MCPCHEPDVRLYTADTLPLYEPDRFEQFYRVVSERRQKKIDRLLFQKDRCLSLGAELLLMTACRDAGIDYPTAEITLGEHSKPCFAGSPLFFNLSHSEQRVACILSRFPAGCDVEKRDGSHLPLARRFFFEEEIRLLDACPSDSEREELFFRLWTLKESFMKCTGLGFHLPLNAFSVSFRDGKPQISRSGDSGRYYPAEEPAREGYAFSWCLQLPEDTPLDFIPACERTEVDFSRMEVPDGRADSPIRE